VYASGLLFGLVGYLAWQAWLVDHVGIFSWLPWGPGILDVFFYTEILCLAVASVVWSAVELPLLRRTPPVRCRGRFLPFTHAAALLALQLLAVLVLGGLASDLTATGLQMATPLGGVAVAGVMSALLFLLRDPDAPAWGLPAPALYAAGALAVGLGLHAAGLPPTVLLMRAALAVAGYVLLTTVVTWSAARSGWSRSEDWPAAWLLAAQTLAAAVVVPLTVWTAVGAEGLADRLTAPLAVALLLPAGVLLAARNADLPRYATLGAGVLALVEVGWALLDPDLPAPWLHRSVMLLVAVALAGFLCGTVLVRVLAAATAWQACVRRTAVALGGLTGVLLAVVMVQELLRYDPEARTTPLAWPAKLALALTLLGILVNLLYRALTPGRDLLRLSDKGRTAYVYAAEGTLVLLLVHLRLSVPDWIPPIIGQYWTLVVMGIAFAGVGLSEWFRRRAVPVLAEPLQRTGLFLPVLPLAAFLTRSLADYREAVGQVVPGMQPFFRILERLPGHFGMHALVWFLLGLLYTLVAVTRRSTPFALLAALACNFGLWVVFASQEPLSFFLHPQLWLIPLALILLAAGQLNRQRLTAAQGAGVRYLGVLLIYVASTADLFLAGLGHSFLMPVILAALCVAGVLAGILLRVRAFLFLGVAFLVLVLFTQIWHAAVDLAQTWVWWACGVALGAAILTLFGLFEKRRNDVLRVVEEIRGWQ
jgi:hypothetical protein